MGVAELMLSVLAFSAPIVTASGYMALIIIFARESAPVALLGATAILMVFSVGYLAMNRHVRRPGAFYAYISLGLGRATGLGAAYLATFAYIVIMLGLYSFVGNSISATIETFGGPTVNWGVCALFALAIVSVLGYFNIEVSARFLVFVMAIEVLIVMIFNVFVLAQGGDEGFSAKPLNPSEYFGNADVGISLLFAMLVFIGFEATALYRDEVKTPDRTIPRATYGAVAFIGILYAFTTYMLVSAYGSGAVDEANSNTAGMFPDAFGVFVSSGFWQAVSILVATSAIASELATHNIATRYMHNLGADRALPRYLSYVHDRHKSPYLASITTSALVLLGLIMVISVDDPALYGKLAGVGSLGVFILMVLVSISVIAWFVRNGVPASESVWNVFVAPALAIVALGSVVFIAVTNFEMVVGGEPGENLWLLYIYAGALVVGLAVGLYYRSALPDRYALLGRADREEPNEVAVQGDATAY